MLLFAMFLITIFVNIAFAYTEEYDNGGLNPLPTVMCPEGSPPGAECYDY